MVVNRLHKSPFYILFISIYTGILMWIAYLTPRVPSIGVLAIVSVGIILSTLFIIGLMVEYLADT